MAQFPAMPLWTDAYIADTQHLSNEEHGVYLKLLMFAWRTPDCDLPADDRRLANMVGVTAYRWAKLKPTILSFWTENDGKLTQKKLIDVRRKVAITSAQRSVAGKASAKAKALKIKDTHSTSVDTNVQRQGQRGAKIQNQNHINPPTSLSAKPLPARSGQRASVRKPADIHHDIARIEIEIKVLQESEVHGADNRKHIKEKKDAIDKLWRTL